MVRGSEWNDLCTELRWAAERLLNLFNKPFQEDEFSYPQLARITERLRSRAWGRDRTGAVRDVVREAIADLPDENPEGLSTTWRQLGATLYALRDDLTPPVDGRRAQSWLKQEAQREANFHGSDATWGRRTKELREKIAAVLLAKEAARTDSDETAGPRRFIARPDITERFRDLTFARPSGVVCLVGPRGSGKSTLAQEMALGTDGADVILLDASDERSLYRGVARELGRRGRPTEGLDTERLARDFTAFLLRRRETGCVVVLDDVSSWHVVEPVVETAVPALFLITSNRGDLRIPVPHALIEVGPMQPDQAQGMVRLLIDADHATDEECGRLAQGVGCLPLAIDHAAALVNEGWISVGGFLGQQLISASEAYRSPDPEGPAAQRSLTFIYRELLAMLRRRCPEAAAVLVSVSVLHHPAVLPMDLLRRVHRIVIHRSARRVSPEFSFGRAVSELKRLRLMQSFRGVWNIHKVPHAILDSLLRDEAGEEQEIVRLALVRAVADQAESVLVSRAVDGVTLGEFSELGYVIGRIERITPEQERDVRLGRAMLVLGKLQEMHGTGQFSGFNVEMVFRALERGGGASPVEDLDSLEMYYARLRSEWCEGKLTPRQYALQLSAVVRLAPQFAPEGDPEPVLWGRIAQVDTCLLLGSPRPAFDHAFRAMEFVLQVVGRDHHLWKGELFQRMGDAQAQLGNWNTAMRLYEFACINFKSDLERRSNATGFAAAAAGVIRSMSRVTEGGTHEIEKEILELCRSQSGTDPEDPLFDPLIPTDGLSAVNQARTHTRYVRAIQACAAAGSAAAFAADNKWTTSLSTWIDPRLLTVEEMNDRLRYRAVVSEQFLKAFEVCRAWTDGLAEGDPLDLLAAGHTKRLLLFLHSLATGVIDTAAEVLQAHTAVVGFLTEPERRRRGLQLGVGVPPATVQHLTATSYCMARLVEAADPSRSVLPLVSPDGRVLVPEDLALAFPEDPEEHGVLAWYQKVAAGAVRPLGILAF
ncbi:AAA family ATPase [Streptomyces sp. SID8381]|uniref:ATP-binding protein n=1 Tax=unclassified Streptomyces TaxID=2593676 RepID=UPI00131A14CA|nr:MULTISPECIES: ATP-binding protein [unclassified Streptomyces]MYX30914.1 AAA family ATPase [Streptomyces sp. SID8381]